MTLNLNSSDVKDPAVLAESIRQLVGEHVQVDGRPVLEQTAAGTIEDFSSQDKYQSEIAFFQGKIPHQDMIILRAAYYLRTVHERGDNVKELKASITQRYGQRGSNISNLCSAGYFESYIRPLYDTLSGREGFTLSMFQENYDFIIDNYPFAFFVNGQQDLADLTQKIIDKLLFNRRYGLHKLTIHAIGRDNIAKVKQLLEDDRVKEIISDEVDTSIKNNIMSVTVHN